MPQHSVLSTQQQLPISFKFQQDKAPAPHTEHGRQTSGMGDIRVSFVRHMTPNSPDLTENCSSESIRQSE